MWLGLSPQSTLSDETLDAAGGTVLAVDPIYVSAGPALGGHHSYFNCQCDTARVS